MKRLAVSVSTCLLLSCVAITLAERQHKRDIAFFQNLLTSRLFDNKPIDTRSDFEVYPLPSAINAPLIQPNTIFTQDRAVPQEMAQILPTTIFYPPIFCRWFGGLDSLQELNTIFSTVNNKEYNPYMHSSHIDGTIPELRLELPVYSPAIEVSNPWAVDIKHPGQLPSRYSYELVQNNMFAEHNNGQLINKPIRTKPVIPTAKNVNAPMAFDLKQQIEIPSKYIYKQLDNNNFVIFTGANTHKGTKEPIKINSALPMTNNIKPHSPTGSSYSYTQMRDNKPVTIFSSKNNPEFVSIKTNPVTSISKEATKPVKVDKSHGGQLGSRYSYKQMRNDDSVIIFTGNDNHGSLKESSNINTASVIKEVGRPFKEDKEVTNQIKPKYSYTQIQNNKPIALYTEKGHTVKTQSKPEPTNKVNIPLAINLNQQSEMQSKYMYKQLKNNEPIMVYTGDNKHTTTVQNNPGLKQASNSMEAASPSSLKINSYSHGNENQQRETETAFLYKQIRNNEPIIMFMGNNNSELAKVPVKMNSALPVGIQAVTPMKIYEKPYNQIGSKYSYTQIREKEPTMIFSSGNNNQGIAKDITIVVENPVEEDKKIVNQIKPQFSYTQIQNNKSKALFTEESDAVSAKTQARPEQPQKMDTPFLNQQSEIQSKYIYKQVKNNEPVMVFTGDNKHTITVINNPGLKKASESIEVTSPASLKISNPSNGNENQQRGTETIFSYKQIRNNEPVMVFTGSNNPELAEVPVKMNSALPVVAPLKKYENQHNQIGSKYSYTQIRDNESTTMVSSGNNNQGSIMDITMEVESPVEDDKKIINQIKPKYSYTQIQNNKPMAVFTEQGNMVSVKTQTESVLPMNIKKRIDDVIMLGAFPYKIRELSPVLRFPPLEDIVYPNVHISNPEIGVHYSTLQSNSQSVNVHSNINNTPDTARVNPVDISQTLGPMPQYDKYIVVETKCVDAKINKEKDNTEDVSRVEVSTNSAAVPHIIYMQSKPVPDNVQTDVTAIATNKVETNANDKVKEGTFLQKHPIIVPDDIKYSYKQKNNDGSAIEFKANKEKVSVDQSNVTEIKHNIPLKDKQKHNEYYVLPVTSPSTTDSSTTALTKATSEVNVQNEKPTSPLKDTYSYQQINHKESSSINVKGNKDGVSVDIMKQSTPNRGDIPDGN